MDDRTFPFRFDFRDLLTVAHRKLSNCVGDVTINLPFISFNVAPDDVERQVAREIVIRLCDRRVLNAKECCDNCIDNALESLQDIRKTLVDKQVELSKATDGPLYLLIEFMLGGIRQFLTFAEALNSHDNDRESSLIVPSDFRRPHEVREKYFVALELLRAHLYRCLVQISTVANVQIPKIVDHMRYNDVWQIQAYEDPQLLEAPHHGI